MGKKANFLSAIALCALAMNAYSSEIKFGTDIDSNFQVIDPSEKIEGNVFSWLAQADQNFGAAQLMFSIYKNNENGSQELLARQNIDVNPKWNAFGAKNSQLPDYGTYTFSLSLLDGTDLASGTVELVEPAKSEPKPAEPVKEEKVGTTLADLFNRYAPKK